MKRIYTNTLGLNDWKARVASPLHWKQGRSAFELAMSWEATSHTPRGLPPGVSRLLDQQDELRDAELLFGFPEHKVALQGNGFPSQSDFWALLRTPYGLVSLAVEAKAGEEFGHEVSTWLRVGSSANSPANRRARLEALCQVLGVAYDEPMIQDLRYQLFHRCASALLEAQRCTASRAILLVQSFDEKCVGWDDFERFGRWLGLSVSRNQISSVHMSGGVSLQLGWADCLPASDAEIVRFAIE